MHLGFNIRIDSASRFDLGFKVVSLEAVRSSSLWALAVFMAVFRRRLRSDRVLTGSEQENMAEETGWTACRQMRRAPHTT